jgi:hypothetical protein
MCVDGLRRTMKIPNHDIRVVGVEKVLFRWVSNFKELNPASAEIWTRSYEYEIETLSDVLPTTWPELKTPWHYEISLSVCVAVLKFTVSNILFLYGFHIGLEISWTGFGRSCLNFWNIYRNATKIVYPTQSTRCLRTFWIFLTFL